MTTTTPTTLTLNNGVETPVLGLGVFQSSPEETSAAVESAIADGYRMIDTAAAYGNEREVGEAIRASGIDRGELFIATKLWYSDYGYDGALVGASAVSASTMSISSCSTIPSRWTSMRRSRRTRRWRRCFPNGALTRSACRTLASSISRT